MTGTPRGVLNYNVGPKSGNEKAPLAVHKGGIMGTDIHGMWQKKTETGWVDIPSNYEQDRHYMLFAWLGNVRNGHGFAGIPTHTPIIPLSNQRGYPKDFEVTDDWHPIIGPEVLYPQAQKYYEPEEKDFWMGDHSHSWVSGAEVLAAKLPSVSRTGVITREEYEKWDRVSSPEEWSAGITGPKIVVESAHELTDKATHVQINWVVSLADQFNYFIDEVKRLQAEHGEVRFVFGFDS